MSLAEGRMVDPLRTPSGWQIGLRYAGYLAREFRWPLGVFWTLVLVVGVLMRFAYHHRPLSLAEACYGVFMMIFLEAYLDFPDEWYLQPIFFLVPIIGLGAVADSLVRLAYLTFARKQRLPEWQQMVASLYRQHVVVVGVGRVGFQVIKEVLATREPVVVVERPSADSELLDGVIELGVPVVRGDGRTRKTLELAGVGRAKAIILATSDDLANLDAGLTARDLNPDVRVVLRLFDESLAEKVRGAFAMPAISTAKVAAPAFVAAATGRKVYQDFQLDGVHVHLIDHTIAADGQLAGKSVGQIQAGTSVNVIMHRGPDGTNVNPAHDLILHPGDEVLIIAPMDALIALQTLDRPEGQAGHPDAAPSPPRTRPTGEP